MLGKDPLNRDDAVTNILSLPAELKLHIFTCLDTESALVALRHTSRSFRIVYQENAQFIVRDILANLAGDKDTLRIAIIAAKSREVDPLDETAVSRFFDKFMSPFGLNPQYYQPCMIGPVRDLISAAKKLLIAPKQAYRDLQLLSTNLSSAECHRLVRSFLEADIHVNLFYRRGVDRGFIPGAKTPFPLLEKRYFAAFSPGELKQLEIVYQLLELYVARGMFQDLSHLLGAVVVSSINVRRLTESNRGIGWPAYMSIQ
jgi:hypothetical protein